MLHALCLVVQPIQVCTLLDAVCWLQQHSSNNETHKQHSASIMANHSGRRGQWPCALLFFAADREHIMPLWCCKNDCSSPSVLQDMISPEVSSFCSCQAMSWTQKHAEDMVQKVNSKVTINCRLHCFCAAQDIVMCSHTSNNGAKPEQQSRRWVGERNTCCTNRSTSDRVCHVNVPKHSVLLKICDVTEEYCLLVDPV